MYSEVFGQRVNLVHVTVVVALYDLIHIFYEFQKRFERFKTYESSEYGCMNDLFQAHCIDTYAELAVYSLDLIFTGILLFGASRVR